MSKFIVILIVLFSWTISAFSADIKLFHIDRSKNKNQVHYDVVVDQGCRILEEGAIKGYWIVLEKGADVREELSSFDQMAYGIKNVKNENGQVYFNLKALESKRVKVSVELKDKICQATAEVEVQGKISKLERIYVFSEEGLILPKVKYLDIFAKLTDGSSVTERITP